MKHLSIIIMLLTVSILRAQEHPRQAALTSRKAHDYLYKANTLLQKDSSFVDAEMAYRKALSDSPSMVGNYNLANSYYRKGNYQESYYRQKLALENATTRTEKHKVYHNIGNILMQNKKCKEAVAAYKNALRNLPSDDQTRYNLALAQACAKKQEQQKNKNDKKKNKDKDKNKDQKKDPDKTQDQDQKNKDSQDKKEEKKDPKKDKKQNENNPNKDPKNKKDQNKQPAQPRPKPGQLSPQQVKSLLEAMRNQEQKVQDKINAAKQKGVKIRTEKDW